MVEHDIRPEGTHRTIETLRRKAFEERIRGAVFAHAVDDVCPRRMLFQHSINRVNIILKIGIHADRHIRIDSHGHESCEQRILIFQPMMVESAGVSRSI